jgi:hypothetical protein
MKQILRRKNLTAISRHVSPDSVVDVSGGNFQRALICESGIIRTQVGSHNRSEMVVMLGSPCAPTP